MSYYWKAIELALQQRYSVDPETGSIYGPLKQLQVKKAKGQDYPTVRLHVEGLPASAYSVPAHKVVAFALWGWDAFAEGVHVRHLDGDTENCRATNLALGSASDNEHDKDPELRREIARRARAAQPQTPFNAKLTEKDAEDIRQCLNSARNVNGRVIRGVVKDLADKYNVSRSAISLIGKGKSWRD